MIGNAPAGYFIMTSANMAIRKNISVFTAAPQMGFFAADSAESTVTASSTNVALHSTTDELHAVFGSDPKTVALSIYPESSFFTTLGRQAEYVIPVSAKHLHVLITVGNFIKKWPDPAEFLWEKQRNINQERVDEIITYLDSKTADTQVVNQCITIALVNNEEPRIIDGRHRLWALSQMDENTKFFIQCVNFSNNDERFIEFVKINSNTPLPDYYKSVTIIVYLILVCFILGVCFF